MQVFDFTDYRNFLALLFSSQGRGRGKRARLAEHLGCQPSFLTQVFGEKNHLSLEYALKACAYLGFSKEEQEYFMLLVLKGKAGSADLMSYFESKLQQILRARDRISTRIQVQTELSAEDQMIYYSTWHYSAIHVLTAIPGFKSVEDISRKLKLDLVKTKQVLAFLAQKRFVIYKNGEYDIGPGRIHLAKDSPMLPRHHANWRMKAIDAVDLEKGHDLHYSAVLGIARKDVKKLRNRLLQLLEEFEPVVRDSEIETPVIFLADLFEL